MTSIFMRERDLDMGMVHGGESVKRDADWSDAIAIKGMSLLVMTRRQERGMEQIILQLLEGSNLADTLMSDSEL